MSSMTTKEMARCDAEMAQIQLRDDLDTVPAYLVAMGMLDWEREKRMIQELAENENPL